MQKSALDLIPQTVDRLAEHYRLLDTIDPVEVEAGNLLDELGDLRRAYLEHEVASFKACSDDNATSDGEHHGYPRKIEELRCSADSSPAVALALNIHARKSVLYNLLMPFSLRHYIADRLFDESGSSKPAKQNETFPFRDAMTVDVIEDLVKHDGLNAYGSSAEGFAGSACWVVAEAQRQLGRRPNSPQGVAKILLHARKADKIDQRTAPLCSER